MNKQETDNQEIKKQWHEGFYGAMELELKDDAANLTFDTEHYLNKEPIRMDMLIIKKESDAPITNEIGHIFRKHNVIEYKSPKDSLTIDDYVKTIGYACLYKSLAGSVDAIALEDITVTLVRDRYPRELIKKLIELGNKVTDYLPGIYYVTGNVMFTTQIVITSELEEEHVWLRVLTDRIKEHDIINFTLEGNKITSQGDKNNLDIIYQISVMANIEMYDEMKRRDPIMCEALKILMKPEIEEGRLEGRQEGIQKGIEQGRLLLINEQIASGILTKEAAAKCINMTVAELEAKLAELSATLVEN